MPSPATISQWAAPLGTLAVEADGSVTAFVRASLRTSERVAEGVAAVVGLARAPFLPGANAQRTQQGFSLRWPAQGGRRESLASLVPGWRETPARHVAEALAVAACVSRSIGELQHLGAHRFLLSPAQLFLETSADGRQAWSVVPLPIDSAQFRDMAAASPELTDWLGGDEILGRGGLDRTHMLAAILYHCLVGDPYAAAMSRDERLARLIAFRAGDAVSLRFALEAAVPAALERPRAALFDFIMSGLGPSVGRPLTAGRAATMLQQLQAELSPGLLAGAWETAGDARLALDILEAHAFSAPPDDVPWPSLARLRARLGEDGDAAKAPVPLAPARPATSIVARIAAAGAAAGDGAGRERLAALLAELTAPDAPALAEDERLLAAYAAARWCGEPERALAMLAADCAASWNRAVRALLIARLRADERAWIACGRACRDCVAVVETMPDRGSERGAYALVHALLLDAAAHAGAVEAGHGAGYLEDAWARLAKAGAILRERGLASVEPLLAKRIEVLRGQIDRQPALAGLAREIEAAAGPRGVETRDELPWPEADWLFSG